MEDFIPPILEFRQAWEEQHRAAMPYPVFEALAIMFPAPCQELYPLVVKDGVYKLALLRRPDTDKLYAGMYHNPGTAHRTTDGITSTSMRNKLAMATVPDDVLTAEKAKPTWDLTPRQKALHRVLSSKEVGVIAPTAMGELRKIHWAGFYPMEFTPRGCECTDLNVWFPDDFIRQEYMTQTALNWFDVRDLPDMYTKGQLIEHQVNRFAAMMDFVVDKLDPGAPRLPRLEEID